MTRLVFRPVPALIIALSAALAACDRGLNDPPLAGRLAVEDDLHRHTMELASDEFQGREPSTPGEQLTVDYIAGEMAAAGLQPGNPGRGRGAEPSWFQEVPLSTMTPAPAPLVIEGAAETAGGPAGETAGGAAGETSGYRREFQYAKEYTAATQRQQARVGISAAPLVFAGYGINAPERGWNDYAGIDAAGKAVIVLVNDPGFATQDPSLFNGNTMTYYGRWTYKYEEAARQGAAAVFVVHETAPAAYPWAVVELGFTGAQRGLAAADGNADAVAVEGWLTRATAVELFAAAGLDYEELKAAAAKPGFRAAPLPGITASVQLEVEVSRSRSRNVVGILPGTEHPEEAIVYTAHWDHFGINEGVSEGEDAIYNGAVDNASGIAGLLALARLHAEHGPYPRSIVFLAVTAEEYGLLGTRHYVEHPLYPLAATVANLNMDSLYKVDGRVRDVAVIGYGNSELETYLAREAEGQGREVVPESNPEKGFFYRSDHFEFAKRGVPALYLGNGKDSREHGATWGQNQLDAYIAHDYHQPSDEYSPDWDMSGAAEDVLLFFGIAEALAAGRDWPNWNEGTEFKAARDATSAARGR